MLAELLSGSDGVPAVLTEYQKRRRKRIDGVRTQSHAAAQAWALPPEVRGDAILRERYEALRERP